MILESSLNDESHRLEGVVNTGQWQRPVVNVPASVMWDDVKSTQPTIAEYVAAIIAE